MTLEYLAGVGPCQANTGDPYAVRNSGGIDSDITITTVGGLNYFRWAGTAQFRQELCGQGASDIPLGQTFQWAIVEGYRLQGVFNAVDDEIEFSILSGLTALSTTRFKFYMVCKTDTSHYVVRVKDGSTTIGTGTTEFAVGTTFHSLRLECNGSTAILDVDTTEEFDVSFSGKFAHTQIGILADTISGPMQDAQEIEIRNMQLYQSSIASDRPDHNDMSSGILTLTGNKVTTLVGKTGADGCVSNAAITEVDDWESGAADDDTTFLCILGGNTGKYIADISDPTVTNLRGVQVWSRDVANSSAKTVAWELMMEDSSANKVRVTMTNLSDETWRQSQGAGFGNGPGITGWTSAKLDDSGIGFTSPGSNEANDKHTAMLAEWFGCALDPPPVVAGRRRALGWVA